MIILEELKHTLRLSSERKSVNFPFTNLSAKSILYGSALLITSATAAYRRFFTYYYSNSLFDTKITWISCDCGFLVSEEQNNLAASCFS